MYVQILFIKFCRLLGERQTPERRGTVLGRSAPERLGIGLRERDEGEHDQIH